MTDEAAATDDEPEAPPTDDTESADSEPVALAYGVPVVEDGSQRVLHASPAEYLSVVEALRDEGFLQCLDVCGVDYLTHPGRSGLPASVEPQRFEVVATFISHKATDRIRIRVQVPVADPAVASLFDLHPGTEAMEREAFDMYGIVFEGHPDLTRILMPEDWSGHPLRKDFAVGAVPVQFKGAPASR